MCSAPNPSERTVVPHPAALEIRALGDAPHPGFEEDLWVEAETAALYRVALGSLSLAATQEDGSVRVAGPPTLAREFRHWLRIR